jgi:hypothetical protein
LVDLDGDGHTDVLSGSWPGELFFFRGKGKGVFEPAVKLKDKNNKSINIGGGVRRDPDGSLTVAGDAKFEKKDGKQFIVYEGEWIEVKPEDGGGITGTASAVFAHDFDGDTDLDLLVGDIRGNVYLVTNEGTKQKWSFGTAVKVPCNGGTVKVANDAGPFVADWDGNGTKDLLVGSGDGSVWVYSNTAPGGSGQTILAAGQQLLPATGDISGENLPTGPARGLRSKVCAADWNGDGRLDLIVGDYTNQKPAPVAITPEQKAEQDKARVEMEPLQERYGELVRNYFDRDTRIKMTQAEREAQGKELGELSQKMQALSQKIPPEYETHGWVWLYLRKPANGANAAAQ